MSSAGKLDALPDFGEDFAVIFSEAEINDPFGNELRILAENLPDRRKGRSRRIKSNGELLPVEILETLNSSLPSLASWRRLREDYERGRAISLEEWATLFRAEVSRLLRLWVDEWIGTGITAEGYETPLTREWDRTDGAQRALLCHRTNSPLFPRKPNLLVDARERAQDLLHSVLMSDEHEFLCKCSYCHHYFLAQKLREASFKHGVFCSRKHQSNALAAKTISSSRELMHRDLIRIAAEKLCAQIVKDGDWHKSGPKKQQLANSVSRYASKKYHVNRNAPMGDAQPQRNRDEAT